MGNWNFNRNPEYEKTVKKLAKLDLLERPSGSLHPHSYSVKNREAFIDWGLALFVIRTAYRYWSEDNRKREDEGLNRDLMYQTKKNIPFSIIPLDNDSVLLLLGIAPPVNADYIIPQKYYNQDDCVPTLLHNLCHSDIKGKIPYYDGSQNSREKIWRWFIEKVKKDKKYTELLGFSFSIVLNVPPASLEILFKGIENISYSVSDFLDVFFTCYASTILNPLVHIANTKLMGDPFYSHELDGVLFEKTSKDLVIIETTAGHDKERLTNKVLSAFAFNSCCDLGSYNYLYLTFSPVAFRNERQDGVVKQCLENDFFQVIEPASYLPSGTEVKELLRKNKDEEIKRRMTNTFYSLINQFERELFRIKEKM
ncbi:MAG: hypothetical protein R6U91_00940 [Bacillota bacterium]